ncbi:MAG: ABC transporter ATP-binding protein [Chloroflexota bacterium]|nr:ABC transporter ATP-binding protein [Chloroflexota bacterium]
MNSPLLSVTKLFKYFPSRGRRELRGTPEQLRHEGPVRAVDGVTFAVRAHETFGLVGESGCGKSTLGRCILRLLEPTAGTVAFGDDDVTQATGQRLRELRRRMQIVFQDAGQSLSPMRTVRATLAEPLRIHAFARGEAAERRVLELLGQVGLEPMHRSRYPHQLSGGQQQRVAIARALATEPSFIVLDEPTSALDSSLKLTVVDLLQQVQEETAVSYLLISHDLTIVRHTCDRVAVMYLGAIVEIGATARIFDDALHPYTQALIASIPIPDPFTNRERVLLPGEPPSPANIPTGCRFQTRCAFVMDRCRHEEPSLLEAQPGHRVACFLYAEAEREAAPA